MPTYQDLVTLEASLRDRMVLTAYVGGGNTDPARGDAWRVDMRHSLDDIERWLNASNAHERQEFASGRELLEAELTRFPRTIGAPGWVCFVTSDGVHLSRALPVPVPTMAAWSTGPCLGPFIRALKEARPVIVAIADSRKVRLFRYADGRAEHVETVEVPERMERAARTGRPARRHLSGARGATDADEAARRAQESTERMLADAVGRIAVLAKGDGWVVIGGNAIVARAALAKLGPVLATRAMVTGALDVHATAVQVAACARECASTLRRSSDLALVTEVIQESQREAGRGVVGVVETMRALEQGAVRELFLTMHYVLHHAVDAEDAIRLALRRGALVEHVSGEAAEQLDAVGGIGARLRYPARTSEDEVALVPEQAIGG